MCTQWHLVSHIQDLYRGQKSSHFQFVSKNFIGSLGFKGFLMVLSFLAISFAFALPGVGNSLSTMSHDGFTVWIDLWWLCQVLSVEHSKYQWINHVDFLGFSASPNDICILHLEKQWCETLLLRHQELLGLANGWVLRVHNSLSLWT